MLFGEHKFVLKQLRWQRKRISCRLWLAGEISPRSRKISTHWEILDKGITDKSKPFLVALVLEQEKGKTRVIQISNYFFGERIKWNLENGDFRYSKSQSGFAFYWIYFNPTTKHNTFYNTSLMFKAWKAKVLLIIIFTPNQQTSIHFNDN